MHPAIWSNRFGRRIAPSRPFARRPAQLLMLTVALWIAAFGASRDVTGSTGFVGHQPLLDGRYPPEQLPETPWTAVLVGQEGGDANGVAVVGDHALLGVGPRLLMLEVSDPGDVSVVWRSEILEDVVADVDIEGDLAVAVFGDSLMALDVSEPRQPREVGSLWLRAMDDAIRVHLHEGFAYVVLDSMSPTGVLVVDLSDPSAPARLDLEDLYWLTGARDAVPAGDYLYVVPDLHIVDISAPRSPVVTSSLELAEGPSTVAVDGDRAFACSMSTLWAVDVSEPTAPEVIGSLALDGGVLAVEGDRVFVAGRAGDVAVVDATDPTRMRVHESVALGDRARDMAWADGWLMVAVPGLGLRVIDADPARAAEVVGGHDAWSGASDVRVREGTAFVAAGDGGLVAVDVSDPLRPRTLGQLDGLGPASRLDLDWPTAYVATVGSGVAVVSVADPVSPTMLGLVPSGEAAPVVAAGNGRLHLLERDAGALRTFDVSRPGSPQALDTLDITGWEPSDAVVVGDWLMVSDRNAGLRVLDADPSGVGQVAGIEYTTPSWSRGLAVVGDRAYAVRENLLRASAQGVCCPPPPPPPEDELVGIDVTSPQSPVLIGDLGPVGWPKGVAAAGEWVVVPSAYGRYYGSSLEVLSILRHESVEIRLPALPAGVGAQGDRAFVVTSDGGLLVVQMVRHGPPTATPRDATPTATPTATGTGATATAAAPPFELHVPLAARGPLGAP